MEERLLAIQKSDMTHAARSLYSVYLAHEDEDGVARAPDGTPLTQKEAAELMGTSPSRASTYFQALRDAGWIEHTPIGPKPTRPEPPHNDRSESKSSQSDNYQSDKSGYQSDNCTYQTDNSPDPSPSSFSLSPKKDYHSTPSHSYSTLTLGSVVEIAISTPPPERLDEVGIGWLPPRHHALSETIPGDHPARSERHLRYRKAAEWSLRLLLQAEDAIESFRVPAAVRRKADRNRLGLLEDWEDIFRLLDEQDRHDWSDVRYAIYWLFTESDWLREGYIASMGSLRKKTSSGDQTKFESILTQARADSSYDGPSGNGRIGGDDRSDESIEERFERNRRAARRAVAA